jgi:SHS family sialic acid transporter-like MFS transporter
LHKESSISKKSIDACGLSSRAKAAILSAAFLALLFDGVELGLMPVASLSVTKSLLGENYTATLGGDWFARYTAALMLGAAIGGVYLGSLGDRIGRSRAMGVCVLFYSLFAGLGAWVQTQEQMLILRFLVGLGVGGLWPNAMALVSECWPGVSRPLVSGTMMAGMNSGILFLSQAVRIWPLSPDSWRWIFLLAALPAALGVMVLLFLPESPQWKQSERGLSRPKKSGSTRASIGKINAGAVEKNIYNKRHRPQSPLGQLFGADLRRLTIMGIIVSCIPMVGAWSASKWMIPWADAVAGQFDSGYKAATQGWWALGATLGSFFGAQLANWLGRRHSYCLISACTFAITIVMFQGTAPLERFFHPIVFAQGFLATLFFGWLALSLPELFPVAVRASGSGLCYNFGRFATAAGVLLAGGIFTLLGGNYATVGTISASVYALGIFLIWFAPETGVKDLAAKDLAAKDLAVLDLAAKEK